MLAEEAVLLERGDPIRLDADFLEYTGTLIPKQQCVVVHFYSSLLTLVRLRFELSYCLIAS